MTDVVIVKYKMRRIVSLWLALLIGLGNLISPRVVKKKEVADLDKDKSTEEYILTNGTLKIFEKSKLIWQTDKDWWVDDFSLADSTNDGAKKINLSIWKPGNFGSSKPFWVKVNDKSIRNHFFVLKLEKNKVQPVWQSSNLAKPNCQFYFKDVNNDKKQELVVIEGEYENGRNCRGNHLAVWQWNGWGFTNLWRKKLSNY